MKTGTLSTVGASQGNPGPAGIGFTLVVDGEMTCRGGSFIGETTSNVAEYTALVWGLENVKAAGIEKLYIEADSELMVNQINGTERAKSEGIKPLYAQVKVLLSAFPGFTIKQVEYGMGSEAELMLDKALATKATVGEYLRRPTLKQSLFDMASAPAVTSPPKEIPVSIDEPIVVAEPDVEKDAVVPAEETKTAVALIEEDCFELTVCGHFDAAHALKGYSGPCRNLHGHTWDIEVSVAGNKLDRVGMLYDPQLLKGDLAATLGQFDHKYLNELEVFRMQNSTAENLARILFEQIAKTLPEGVEMSEVCVRDSRDTRVRYRKRSNIGVAGK